MTLWPAYAAFMEQESGTLTPEEILQATVVMTVLGGRVVYRK